MATAKVFRRLIMVLAVSIVAIPSVNAGGGKGICVLETYDFEYHTIQRICIDGYEWVETKYHGHSHDIEQVFIKLRGTPRTVPKPCKCPK